MAHESLLSELLWVLRNRRQRCACECDVTSRSDDQRPTVVSGLLHWHPPTDNTATRLPI